MKLRVDSFHISVHEGDCAIHLLVDIEDKGDKEGMVKAAVLIDSGKIPSTKDAEDGIESFEHPPVINTMNWIEDAYTFDESTGLKLDSIIITHWDTDHYEGISSILQNAAREADGPGQIPWLKWNGERPLTHFYCPSERGDPIRIRHKRKRKVPSEGGEKKPEINGLNRDYYEVHPPDDGTTTKTVSVKVPIDKKTFTTYKFAQFHDTDNDHLYDVLGVEFFRNTELPEELRKKKPISLSQLMSAHGLRPDEPGLYCVGVSGHNLSDSVNTLILNDSGVTLTNQASIAAIIAWPTTPVPRVSHYFGGDLGQAYEEPIQKWLKAGDVNKITSVKVNHHGSPFSTPLDLFETFQPVNTFVPSPINGLHNHPGKQ